MEYKFSNVTLVNPGVAPPILYLIAKSEGSLEIYESLERAMSTRKF